MRNTERVILSVKVSEKPSPPWLRLRIEEQAFVEDFPKSYFRPLFGGWHDGVDPWPGVDDDTIVKRAVYERRFVLDGVCAGISVKVGEPLECGGMEFLVTEAAFVLDGATRIKVKAVAYPPINISKETIPETARG